MRIGDKVTLNSEKCYSKKQCELVRVVDEIHCNGSITAIGGNYKGMPTCITLPKEHFKLLNTNPIEG